MSNTFHDLLNPKLAPIGVERGNLSVEALAGASALALPVAPAAVGESEVQPRWGTADAALLYGIDLAELAVRSGATGEGGNIGVLHLPRPVGDKTFPWQDLPLCIYLVGIGDATSQDLRRAGAALARRVRSHAGHVPANSRTITTVGAEAQADAVRAFLEGFYLGGYTQQRWTGSGLASIEDDGPHLGEESDVDNDFFDGDEEPKESSFVENELVLVGRHPEQAVALSQAGARATLRTRALASAPSHIKNPEWFVEQAQDLAEQVGLKTDVWDQERLEEEGFGGILAVGGGSASEPRMLTLTYEPEETDREHVVLVGKGITYDTGGLSIKPRTAMVGMKTDMAGAAATLAAIVGAAELRVPQRITAVLPLAENSVSGSAYRPGDVVRTYGGRTVEIANTDAEGRMVLADALAWADENLDPDVLIDIATLTGAATLGLGRGHSAAYSADLGLISQLALAGEQTGEKVWHMPLVEEYRDAVRSDVAELRHVPNAEHRFSAGSITAALFLREFVGERNWVHLDIAGPARATSAKHEISEGATGYGARLLLRWLENAS